MAASARVGARHQSPRWLTCIRSATLVNDAGIDDDELAGTETAQTYATSTRGLTYTRAVFSSPLSSHGPRVVVERALVDTGSSDCELREGFLRQLGPLPVIARGAVYETACGGQPFDAYEVLLTIAGRTCACVVTSVPEERFDTYSEDPCSDESLIGHMALGALRIAVDVPGRRLLRHDGSLRTIAGNTRSEQSPESLERGQSSAMDVLSGRGGLQMAMNPRYFQSGWGAIEENLAWACDGGAAKMDGDLAPRWLRRNGCAFPVATDEFDSVLPHAGVADLEQDEAPIPPIPGIIPVTYVRCIFRSPLDPGGKYSLVEQALVDTGSSDCELRESFVRQLGVLPTVMRGGVYETVSGRHRLDSYEVLLTIGGRSCACVVTSVSEDRFGPDAEDPNSDDAVVGFAALAALGLLVDPYTRRLRLSAGYDPSAPSPE